MNNEINEVATEEIINEEITTEETNALPTESMDDYKDELQNSLKKIREGDILKGTVIGVSDTEVTVDLGYYAEGIIPITELSNDPRFSIKQDILVGDDVSATVIKVDNGEGNILLSLKNADDILAWDKLNELMNNKVQSTVKIAQVVNGGVITYLNGIRAFIPASQLSLQYVENLEEWVNKEVSTYIVTVDKANNKLVLSAKEVEKEKAENDKSLRIKQVQIGTITEGTVDKITAYGAFIKLPDNLSGLVHISQISHKRIKTPNEVLKIGDKVTVKIIDSKEGKISLSIKAVSDNDDVEEKIERAPVEYSTGQNVGTSLAGLLSGLKI